MTTDALLHPDQLQPGHMVGPWKIVKWLGTGGSACVFEVERDGSPFAMKMALRPISDEEDSEGEAVAMRMGHEAAALLTYFPHRNLVRVHAVDCWPHPRRGYLFIVTDLVDGDDWHTWRWKTNPDATRLTDTFSEVVRTVGVLHVRGVYHRDLKAENLLIRREDGRPFLIDFGNVRLPGTFAKTMGVPPAVFHLLPPELLAYLRGRAWKEGVPFRGGVGADLYALGVLLYQGLTDHHPFDPKLPDEVLTAAISTVPPEAPHLLNPRAPRSLSDIAMKLLEKQPEDRYPDTEALLRALWQTGKERTSRAWRVPLLLSTENAPVEAREEWLSRVQEEAPMTEEGQPQEEAQPQPEAREEGQPQEEAQPQPEAREEAPPATRHTWRVGHLAVVSLLLLGFLFLASWLVWATLAPHRMSEPTASVAIEKGSAPVPTLITSQDSTPARGNSSLRFLAVWLCTATGLGCPAAQVRPEPENCSEEARRNMFEVLKLNEGMELQAIVDINQPGDPHQEGTYRDGPIVGRVVQRDWSPPELPGGTLLYGRLWTGPGIQTRDGEDAVLGRYTEALLPDGRKLPVCIVLGGPQGRWPKEPGSKPNAVRLPRELPVGAVRRWP